LLTFPSPPPREQRAIASFLDEKTSKIDQAIRQKEKLIALLKERKQIIIQNAVTKGLDPAAKMKDSGVDWIGEIPEGWEVKRLKELCSAFGRIGFRGYSTSDLVDEGDGAITISPSNIRGEEMFFDKCSYLKWEKYHESPEIQIFESDVLVVKTGSTVGKVGFVNGLPEKATINPQLLVFKEIIIPNEFFYELLSSQGFQTQISKEVIGSTIPTISETKLMNMKVVLPPMVDIGVITQKIKAVKEKFNLAIALQEKQIGKLKEYKAVLIDGAVTGKIKVTNP
jgi:type I restriction enzyme S subunit